jgi:ribosomal protein L37AE/L43A
VSKMPKREDEFWAAQKEGRGRGLCPRCGSSDISYNPKFASWRCNKCEHSFPMPSYGPGGWFGKEARWFGKTTEGERRREFAEAARRTRESKSRDDHLTSNIQPKPAKSRASNIGKKVVNRPIQNWLWALLLIFALSIIGLGINIYIGSLIPFWLLLGFSCIYSVEKWFSYITRKYKGIGKSYRLLLNLCVLSLFGLLIWSGIKLFSQKLTSSPLFGGLVFVAEFVFFIWMWRVVSKNSWRWPSMKLTIFSLIGLFLVFSFAGVQPMASYKDESLSFMGSIFSSSPGPAVEEPNSASATPSSGTVPSPQPTPSPVPIPTPAVTQPPNDNNIDPTTGMYKNYYLGLINTTGGILSGSGCYDDTGNFIILINNKKATNPTYNELVSFLQKDKTDEFPYKYTNPIPGFYYGTAESHVDLTRIKHIIDGNVQPDKPNICDDFAERLHNDAELAGIRCAYVSVDLSGYPDPYHYGIPSNTGHALDAFQTVDRGLVYVDDTNTLGPTRSVATVNVVVGQAYIPILLFNDAGWQSMSMGTVTNIELTWDGTWNN